MIRKHLVLITTLLFCGAFTSSVVAQRNELAPKSGSQLSVAAKQPVVSVAFAPIDQLLGDVNYVATAAESQQSGLMFGSMANAFTQGLDRTRPFGLVVYLTDGVPAPMLMLPVSDLNAFLKGLEAFVGQPDVDNDGTLIISVGPNLVFVKEVKGWAFAARDRSVLDQMPADPLSILRPLTKDYSLAVQLNVQAVPPELRQVAIGALEGSFDRALQAQGGDVGKEAGGQAARQQLEMLKRFIDQTATLQLGWRVDPTARFTGLDILTTATEGSEMSQMLGEVKVAPTRFSGFVQTDAAAYLHGSNKFGPLLTKQNLAALENLPQQMKSMLKAALDQGKIDVHAQEILEGLIDDAVVIARDSVQKGYSDMGATARMDNESLSVVSALSPVDGSKVEELVAQLQKNVQAKTGDVRFNLAKSNYKGVKLHEISVDIPAHEEDARKVLGPTLTVTLGTSPETLYMGVGTNVETQLKQAIDTAAQGPQALPDQVQSQARIMLLPIFEYAQSIAQNSMVDMVLQKLREYPELSDVSIVSNGVPRGSLVQIQISEGILRAIGTAAQSARRQPKF